MDLKTTLVAAALAFGVSALVVRVGLRDAPETQAAAARPAARAPAVADYDSLLDELDRRIDGLQQRVHGRPDDWLTRGHLATALLERAGLTNRLEDFARVQAVLDDAFSIARQGSGPLVVAARFNFSIHRLAVAEQHLDLIDRRAVPRPADQLFARALRAEIAVQRGQYPAARDELTAVAAVMPALARAPLALYHAKTGDPAAAAALLADEFAATPANDPRRRAWMQLQLAVVAMERGDLKTAQAHLDTAGAELPGWWLVQEHLAELHNRRNEHDRALEILEKLAPKTGLPQHMDALASVYRHLGRSHDADALIAQAGALWDKQLARFPEAAMGHALQHHLEFGAPERALELALANHAARPGGEAKVALAQAYLKADRPADALVVAEEALASAYRSARLHDVAARAHRALGHTAAADEQAALILTINPWYSSTDHTH